MDQAEFTKKEEKVKSYKIVLRNAEEKSSIEFVEKFSFAEAASYAYLLRNKLGYSFKIVSISEC